MCHSSIALAAHRLYFVLTGTLFSGSLFALPVSAESAERNTSFISAAPAHLNIRADRQYTDFKSKASVAEGNVSIQLGNAELRADRIEFGAEYRTLHARGAVRFKRGSQYFQASSFRYNLVQKEGLLNDVYGVIDLKESLSNPLTTSLAASPPSESPIPARLEDMPPVACPPLLPPLADNWLGRGTSEPGSASMRPLPECENTDREQSVQPFSLSDRLESIALGDGGDQQRYVSSHGTPAQHSTPRVKDQALRKAAIAQIDQRISNIALTGNFSIEQRGGIPNQHSSSAVRDENSFGVVRPAQSNRLGNSQLFTGKISLLRVQASEVLITKDGWKAERMGLSNDPYTPAQARIEAEGVIAREQSNGELLLSARRNRLIVEERLHVPMPSKHRFRKKTSWTFGIDNQDRDGFFIGRNLQPIEVARDFTLSLQPQFMVQRAINGQNTTISELFGLKAELKGQIWGWDTTWEADITTFKPQDLADGSRYWGNLENDFELPWLGDITARLFGAYRYRTWNGSLGETDIYAALGGFIEQRKAFSLGKSSNSYLWRLGLGNYRAERFSSVSLVDSMRANFYASINSSYPIWRGKEAPMTPEKAYRYSPVAIVPGLTFDTNVNTLLAAYGDGTHQNTISFSGGPTLTLGTFSQPFLDYTRVSMSGGVTLKQGSSPFNFDQAVDLSTLGIGITQQIVGPLLLNAGFDINVDAGSEFYGDVINSNIELSWQRRSYDFGIYFNPYEGIGGIRFRLHDFDFNGTGVPFMPYTPTNWMKTNNADRPF